MRASVTDTGEGMAEEVRARAFDPFFTTKPVGKGSGLGLSQVYALVRQSRGTVRIDSAPGHGTTIRLYLPRASAPAAPLVTPADDAPADDRGISHGGGTHIALLDDEDTVRDVVGEILQEAGYRVSGFAVPEDALAAVAADASITLLITDFGLPGHNGAEVARLARCRRPTLPVVFISGHIDAATLGREPWQLNKPFSAAALLTVVARALHARPAVV